MIHIFMHHTWIHIPIRTDNQGASQTSGNALSEERETFHFFLYEPAFDDFINTIDELLYLSCFFWLLMIFCLDLHLFHAKCGGL